jgi:hypothetical protein
LIRIDGDRDLERVKSETLVLELEPIEPLGYLGTVGANLVAEVVELHDSLRLAFEF